jgi:hypothetical protein
MVRAMGMELAPARGGGIAAETAQGLSILPSSSKNYSDFARKIPAPRHLQWLQEVGR